MERSIFSGRHCFIENLHDEKKMTHSEYTVLCEWFDFLQKSPMFNLSVDLIVYLKTSPEVAFERVKRRARSEEKVSFHGECVHVSCHYIKVHNFKVKFH